MNWSVSAGPTIEIPGVIATGPCMWTLRMPRRFSSPLAVALPMSLSESISDCAGRWISRVSIGGFTLGMTGSLSLPDVAPCRSLVHEQQHSRDDAQDGQQ